MLGSLLSHADDEIVADAAWAISYICDGGKERVQAVLATAPVLRLIELLAASSAALQTPAIRAIAGIVSGTEEQTQAVVDAGTLSNFAVLLNHPKRGIRKEACWALSNILAGTKEQIQAVIAALLMAPLLSCMIAMELEVKKEAVWAIANLTTGGSAVQVEYLVRVGGLDSLGAVLGQFDPKIVPVALEAIENILTFGETIRAAQNLDRNPYAVEMAVSASINSLQALQACSDHDISSRARMILDTYFEQQQQGHGFHIRYI